MSRSPSVPVEWNPEGLRIPVSGLRMSEAVRLVLRSERVRKGMVSVTLLTPRRMAALNRRHVGHTGPTDAIAFSFRDPAGAVIGDIYLCPAVAIANARRFGVSVREELLRLAVHASLHVVGYDHPEGEERVRSPMWRKQERLLARVLAS